MKTVENKKPKNIKDIYDALPADSRNSLMDFAEFLFQRDAPAEAVSLQKQELPRPETESVVAALKRLNASYPMIERKLVFHESSSLMTEHILQGRDAGDVIDELESLFDRHYQALLTAQEAADVDES